MDQNWLLYMSQQPEVFHRMVLYQGRYCGRAEGQ